MFRNYYEVRDWLEGYIPHTYTRGELGLERIENLLEKLGNPERKFKSVHVAGTSAKGSTSFYIARLLESFGLKVGLHVSPHLLDIRERMQINGKLMPIRRFVDMVCEIKDVVDDIKRNQPELTPSYFEILAAMSFLYFAREKVDFAVVEVGLGGRLDATNVLSPEVCVITNIGLDHMEILGNTISKIAKEKAGIIKMGIPVVTGGTGIALKVIKKTAKEKKAPLYTLDTRKQLKGLILDTKVGRRLLNDIERYGQNDFAYFSKKMALLAVLTLKDTYFKNLKRDKLTSAFFQEFPGRFEEISKGVVLDGAHNPDKTKYLVDYVNQKVVGVSKREGLSLHSAQGQPLNVVLVVAFKQGKKWKEMLDILIKNLPVKQIFATEYQAATDTGFGSAVSAEEIAKYVDDRFQTIDVRVVKNSQKAVLMVLKSKIYSPKSTLILVTGSLYLVGEARTLWKLPEF